jgi:hypothetical protein
MGDAGEFGPVRPACTRPRSPGHEVSAKEGRVDPKARYIGGSDTVDLNKDAIPIPGIEKNVHTIKVDWHLHKID